ncbi:potassium transporter Kup [Mesorhizobium sp. GbtcB19]|uniref:potassium transporter Kup n=1 Tax=Mesorhizobium sp. GbtcB19 TaxID=2824764 RepID=UPI001C30E1CA|nr:KUP/HAK/KT family potassium transporter [Mesorhizobium sp. GbtcB19]
MTAAARPSVHHMRDRALAATALGCLGVVFGDIGTSPLYALQVAINSATPAGSAPAPQAIIGIVSLIFWSLLVIISIKYAILIMRADNGGEGGILALLALVSPRRATQNRTGALMVLVGLFGATLLYGDGAITPAMSVLSAIEGLKIYAPQTDHVVVPLTGAILMMLFFLQKKGTNWIGGIFGPVMLVWFAVIGILGISGIVKEPAVLGALSPWPALSYLWQAGPIAFTVIGTAFLAVTGGEALYADMGHFGPFPIRVAWFGVALPTLTLNYFGQGGLLLADPSAIENPFYRLAPEWSHYGLVALATAATVIASQAIITGAYSLTQQANQLGLLPRLRIIHTARHERAQIYIPLVNWTLALATLTAVLGFRSSDALAGAYGIAVSLLMVITTALAAFVALHWKHNPLLIVIVNGSLLLLELLYFASASTKLLDGGWFPLTISLVIAFLMLTWRRGVEMLDKARLAVRQTVDEFDAEVKANPPFRIDGTAVVLGRLTKGIPLALSLNLKLNRVLHQKVLLVAIDVTGTPRVCDEERAVIQRISDDITRVELRYGFMESPDVPGGLKTALTRGQIGKCELSSITYYIGHDTIVAGRPDEGMALWREHLFALMHRNAQRPGASFKIPAEQVMEIGLEFKI